MTTVVHTNCGTYGGYQRHTRRGEVPCAECKKANREYAAARRADDAVRIEENARSAARQRALWRLAAEYPDRFRQLFIEEVSS